MEAIKSDKNIRERLNEAEFQKKQMEIRNNLNSIPNAELSACKCKCGSVLWEASMILYTVPSLHPKNSYGEVMQRSQQLLVCRACGKSHPDQLDPNNKAYIPNLPEELK